MVDRQLARAQLHDGGDQVTAETAADAAAGNADEIALARLDQAGVDRELSEIIDENGEAAAVGAAQQRVDQGRLAGAEIAADQRDRGAGRHIVDARNGRPACTVPRMRTSFRRSPPISLGSSSRTAKSARLPLSMEPISLSRPSV